MDEKWYYVEDGDRRGPISLSEIRSLVSSNKLTDEDFVWKKGMENWTKVAQVPEVNVQEEVTDQEISESFELSKMSKNENSIFIKIGADRGGASVEYGPYSLEVIKKLFDQNRINAKTYVFLKGMKDWQMLADFVDYGEIFEGVPPVIEEEERRRDQRKPFIARMFFESDKKVYVGICRDVSVGGMQVLVDQIPAPIGQRISINVHPENTDHHFVADGEVVRHLEGGQGFSFRFLELNNEAKEAIEKYITNGNR